MLKNITSNSRYIQANGGTSSPPYINMSNASAGMIRYNGTSQNMEIYDGMSWLTLSTNYATVGLTIDAESAIAWAKRQMEREARREQLIKENPALKKAYEAIKRAEDNFDILEKFVENDNTSSDNTGSP
jgi:hypothetical protein